MKHFLSLTKLGLLFTTFKAMFSYLDPGSGSLIIQLIVAAIVGFLATYRFWKSRFLSLFGIQPQSDDETESELEDTNEKD
jgi:hypothetical protein